MTYEQALAIHMEAKAQHEAAERIGAMRPWTLELQRRYYAATEASVDAYNRASRAYAEHVATWNAA